MINLFINHSNHTKAAHLGMISWPKKTITTSKFSQWSQHDMKTLWKVSEGRHWEIRINMSIIIISVKSRKFPQCDKYNFWMLYCKLPPAPGTVCVSWYLLYTPGNQLQILTFLPLPLLGWSIHSRSFGYFNVNQVEEPLHIYCSC